MISKEAFERLLKDIVVNETILITKYCYSALNDINTIKQDLELLDEINNVWHKNEPMESVDINGNHLQELYDFIHKLCEENSKLKKVIEILKDKTIIIFALKLSKDLKDYNRMTSFEKLTQEEYDLLKEYFK